MRKEQILTPAACLAIRAATVSGPFVLFTSSDYGLRCECQREAVRAGAKLHKDKEQVVFPSADAAAAWVGAIHLPRTEPIRGDSHSYFPTPPAISLPLLGYVVWEGLPPNARILEPSAGHGHLLAAILAALDAAGRTDVVVHALEWQYDRQQFLTQMFAGRVQVVGNDFLAYAPGYGYDLIVMNPPFTVPDDKLTYLTHIEHASRLLVAEGVVLAVTPPNWQFSSVKRAVAFKTWAESHAEMIDLPADGFKEAGTDIRTVGLYIQQPYPALPPAPLVVDGGGDEELGTRVPEPDPTPTTATTTTAVGALSQWLDDDLAAEGLSRAVVEMVDLSIACSPVIKHSLRYWDVLSGDPPLHTVEELESLTAVKTYLVYPGPDRSQAEVFRAEEVQVMRARYLVWHGHAMTAAHPVLSAVHGTVISLDDPTAPDQVAEIVDAVVRSVHPDVVLRDDQAARVALGALLEMDSRLPMRPDTVWERATARQVDLRQYAATAVARTALKRHGAAVPDLVDVGRAVPDAPTGVPESAPPAPTGHQASPTPSIAGLGTVPIPPPVAPRPLASAPILPTTRAALELAADGAKYTWVHTPPENKEARARAMDLYSTAKYRLDFFVKNGRLPPAPKKGK